MARMSDLMIDIEEMLRDGFSDEEVAKQLGVPYQWVVNIRYAMDPIDSDRFKTCNFVEEE